MKANFIWLGSLFSLSVISIFSLKPQLSLDLGIEIHLHRLLLLLTLFQHSSRDIQGFFQLRICLLFLFMKNKDEFVKHEQDNIDPQIHPSFMSAFGDITLDFLLLFHQVTESAYSYDFTNTTNQNILSLKPFFWAYCQHLRPSVPNSSTFVLMWENHQCYFNHWQKIRIHSIN